MKRGQVAAKTKYQMQLYLAARVTNEREVVRKGKLKDWISSVLSSSEITEEEVLKVLIFFYSEIRPDEVALEALQNDNVRYLSTKNELFTNLDDIPGTGQKLKLKGRD